MYNLMLDRRTRDRRKSERAIMQRAAKMLPNRRALDRRNDQRPLDEFPYLPHCGC